MRKPPPPPGRRFDSINKCDPGLSDYTACGCGEPAVERIDFGNGDVRWYCYPCS